MKISPWVTLLSSLVLTLNPVASVQAQTGQTVFFDDFETSSGLPSGWVLGVDTSTTCPPPYKTTMDDVDAYVVPGSNWPGHGRVFVIHANTHSEPATFANSIGFRSISYKGAGNYQVQFDTRMWRTDSIYKNQYYGMNLAITRNGKEYFAEVNIEANPSSPNYGWLMYRQGTASPWTRYPIVLVGTDPTVWRHLIVNVLIDTATNYYFLESVNIKGTWYTLHVPLASWTVPWANRFGLLLESSNQYTNCTPSKTFVGIAVYDNVRITYFPF